jgi:hypothetical protein
MANAEEVAWFAKLFLTNLDVQETRTSHHVDFLRTSSSFTYTSVYILES